MGNLLPEISYSLHHMNRELERCRILAVRIPVFWIFVVSLIPPLSNTCVHASKLFCNLHHLVCNVRMPTDQCNCHVLSTKAPADLAVVPTPDPVISAFSLSLAHLPVFETWWWNSLRSLPRTSHELGRDRPDFLGQRHSEICSGGSVANSFEADECAKQARKVHCQISPQISPLQDNLRTGLPPRPG